ncbi:unnamed protein product, partial [Ilex paraguariensis]
MTDIPFFTLQGMQHQIERLNLVFGEVRDRTDQQEAAIRNLQGEDLRMNLFEERRNDENQ